MEEAPLNTASCINQRDDQITFGNFDKSISCNMRINDEPQAENGRVSFNTGSYLNSNDLEKDKSKNKPENLSPVLWFYSLSKKKKICVGVSCLFFLLLLIIALCSIKSSKNYKSNQNSTAPQEDTKPSSTPEPVQISCPRAWFQLSGSLGNKASGGCYHFGSEEKTQMDSYRECQARSGYLVEITSEVEHHFLSQKLQEISSLQKSWSTWWIGLHLDNDGVNKPVDNNEGSGINALISGINGAMDLVDNDGFPEDSEWLWKRSQLPLSQQIYTGWIDSSTNRFDGNCVITDRVSSWMWRTAQCNQKHFFICEIDAIRF